MGPLGYMCGNDANRQYSNFLCECLSSVRNKQHDVQTDSYLVCIKIAMLSCSSGAINMYCATHTERSTHVLRSTHLQ